MKSCNQRPLVIFHDIKCFSIVNHQLCIAEVGNKRKNKEIKGMVLTSKKAQKHWLFIAHRQGEND